MNIEASESIKENSLVKVVERLGKHPKYLYMSMSMFDRIGRGNPVLVKDSLEGFVGGFLDAREGVKNKEEDLRLDLKSLKNQLLDGVGMYKPQLKGMIKKSIEAGKFRKYCRKLTEGEVGKLVKDHQGRRIDTESERFKRVSGEFFLRLKARE